MTVSGSGLPAATRRGEIDKPVLGKIMRIPDLNTAELTVQTC